MYFDSFAEFLAMGDHGLYVWTAYAVFLILIIWNLFMPKLRRRQVLNSLVRYWRRELSSNSSDEEKPLPYAEQDS